MRGGSAGRSFLKPFFLIWEDFFQSFHAKFLSSFHDIIGFENFPLSFRQAQSRIMMSQCSLYLCYTFQLVLHLNCSALSQSESHNFFDVYYCVQLNSSSITRENITWLKIIQADEVFSVLYQIYVHLSIYMYFSISQRRQRKWTASLIGTVFLGMYQSLHLALIPLHDTNQLLHQILPRVM